MFLIRKLMKLMKILEHDSEGYHGYLYEALTALTFFAGNLLCFVDPSNHILGKRILCLPDYQFGLDQGLVHPKSIEHGLKGFQKEWKEILKLAHKFGEMNNMVLLELLAHFYCTDSGTEMDYVCKLALMCHFEMTLFENIT